MLLFLFPETIPVCVQITIRRKKFKNCSKSLVITTFSGALDRISLTLNYRKDLEITRASINLYLPIMDLHNGSWNQIAYRYKTMYMIF